MSLFRRHLWAFVVANLALNAANWVTGRGWWAFWPLAVWGVLLAVHYMVHKSRRVSDRWVDERTQDVRSRSYDRAHIDSIEKRYTGGEKQQ